MENIVKARPWMSALLEEDKANEVFAIVEEKYSRITQRKLSHSD